MTTLFRRMFQRGDTASAWTTSNPVLGEREIGVEKGNPPKMKVGDGVTPWNGLPYISGGSATELLADLLDVDVSAAVQGDTVVYDSSSELWVAAAPSGGGSVNPLVHIAEENGVVGDGTTDDGAALNALIADVQADGGGVVEIRSRSILTTDKIVMGDLVRVRGQGRGITTIRLADGSSNFILGIKPVIDFTGSAGGQLMDLTVDGGVQLLGDGIAVTSCTDALIANVEVKRATGYGVYVNSAPNAEARGLKFGTLGDLPIRDDQGQMIVAGSGSTRTWVHGNASVVTPDDESFVYLNLEDMTIDGTAVVPWGNGHDLAVMCGGFYVLTFEVSTSADTGQSPTGFQVDTQVGGVGMDLVGEFHPLPPGTTGKTDSRYVAWSGHLAGGGTQVSVSANSTGDNLLVQLVQFSLLGPL